MIEVEIDEDVFFIYINKKKYIRFICKIIFFILSVGNRNR